jgi:hypothetical protein
MNDHDILIWICLGILFVILAILAFMAIIGHLMEHELEWMNDEEKEFYENNNKDHLDESI